MRAGSWTLAGHGLGQAIRLASNLVMTRLLVPEMFGVMAIALTVATILNMLSDLGLRQNIVQSRRGDDPVFLDTAFVVQVARGFLLWLLALGLSLGIYLANHFGIIQPGTVYADPDLPWVIALSSLSAVLTGFQSTKVATAHRTFNQKRIIQIALISQLIALLAMILFALAHQSVWALVTGSLISTLTTTVLTHSWMTGHDNRFRYDRAAFEELLAFGKWVFISSGLYVFAINGDRLLLGAFLDSEMMGLYVIASLFIASIAGTLNKLFFTVSLPALSEVARTDRGRLKSIYNKLCIPGDVLLLFLTGLLFQSGDIIIDLLYDPRYASAGQILQILALSLFAVRYEVARQVYLALGLPQYGTVLSVVRFAALCLLTPALYSFGGTNAVIWGIALHPLAAVPFVYFYNIKLKLNDFRRELLVLPALPAGVMLGWAAKAIIS